MRYEVRVESEVPGDVAEDAERMLSALDEATADMDEPIEFGVNDTDRTVLGSIVVDATDARDAFEQGAEVWDTAWEEAFADATPERFAVTAKRAFFPVRIREEAEASA